EHQPVTLGVVGSSPIRVANKTYFPQGERPCRADAGSNASVCGRSSSGRAPPCQGGGSEFEPRRPLQKRAGPTRSTWWRGQVVRQRSAKPSFTSSNLVATSRTL